MACTAWAFDYVTRSVSPSALCLATSNPTGSDQTITATKDKTYLVGANYPPQVYLTDPRDGRQRCHSYIGRAFQWVRAFREEAMTLAWSVSRRGSAGMHDPDLPSFQNLSYRRCG